MSWYRRLANAVRPGRLEHDIEREIAFHVAELVDELVAEGMDPHEARREARRRFGNRETVRHGMHVADAFLWAESLLSDVRFAARSLFTNRGVTLVGVLSLALGIGANVAIFSLINAVMLRSLPIPHPDRLVQVTMGGTRTSFTNPLWEQIRDRQEVLDGVLAFGESEFELGTGGLARHTRGAWVSGSYFDVVGLPAAAGRLLTATDDRRGCAGVAVLSHAFWMQEYGGAPDVVGRTITLQGKPFEVVGVAAPGFSGLHVGQDAGVFVPLCSVDVVREQDILDARSTWFLSIFGRLRPGTPLDEVRSGLAAIAPAVYEQTVPTHWRTGEQADYRKRTLGAVAAPNGRSIVRGQYRTALFVLLAVVAVVLLIACANIAQLLLARAAARQHEIGLRLALGSGRLRLVRQLLTESLLLSLLGGAVGVLFARWSSELLVTRLAQGGQAVSLDLTLDARVLGFAMVLAIVTGLLFGVAPAWRLSRVDPQAALHGAGRGSVGAGRQRFANGLVVAQIALSLVLVTAAGLLVGSFRRMATIDPGFRAEGVLVVRADWSSVPLAEPRQRVFVRELLEVVRAVPGVRAASASLRTPIGGSSWNDEVVVDGEPGDQIVWFNGVTDGYLDTFGTRLLSGRDFTRHDGVHTPAVALVNQAFVRRYFGDDSPLGKTLRTDVHGSLGPPMEIVGVVEDAKYSRLDEEERATAYVPLEQTESWGPTAEIALHGTVDPAALIPAVTRAIDRIQPSITLEFSTLDAQVATSLARPRLLATLSGFFGLLALLLAVIGLYGTMGYHVARRRNEFGIRIALGAVPVQVLRLVAREAGVVIALGLVAGTVLALMATRLVASFLFGVTPSDPATLLLSASLLAAVALIAGLVPAWSASGVDPMVVLRDE